MTREKQTCTTALITVLGSTYTATDTTINYTYDNLAKHPVACGVGNRLTAADYSTGMYYHYEYDSVGNRLQQVSAFLADPVTTDYTYDDANRLTTADSLLEWIECLSSMVFNRKIDINDVQPQEYRLSPNLVDLSTPFHPPRLI